MKIPYTDRDAPLDQQAVELADVLTDREERLLARHVLASGRMAGFPTVGGMLRWFEGLDPIERKHLVDKARAKLGIKTRQQARIESADRAAANVAAIRSAWQLCPECGAQPVDELGTPIPVNVRRWWCAAHRHLAGPDDMQPRSSGIRISESGALVPVDEGEQARQAAEEESIRRRRAAEQASRAAEVEAQARHEQALAEQLARELPPGFPGASR